MRAGKHCMRFCTDGLVFAVLTLIVGACSKPEEVISTRIAQANQNLESGRVAEAVASLEKLDSRFPRNPAVLEALAFAYARADQHRQAAACFIAAAEIDPNASSLRQLAAQSYQHDGALDLAAEQHRLVVAANPENFQSWQRLGEIEDAQGNVLRGVDAYLKWYRLRPNGEAAFRLGVAFRRLNNSPQAKTWFETTIRHAEAHLDEALLRILELEIEAGDFASAEKTVGQIDRNFPGVLDASPLAGIRQRITTWKEAEAAVAAAQAEQERLAREIAETRRRQQEELANALQREAEVRASPAPAADSPFAVPAEPVAGPVRTDLPPVLQAALARKEAGEFEQAAEILWRALAEDDSSVVAWAELADTYRLLKQYSPAESCILEARRRAPDSIEVETTYLNIVRESQPPEVYLARVETARRRFPANASLAYVLARELAATGGDPTRAAAAYGDFLLLADPADPRRAEASEFLARSINR